MTDEEYEKKLERIEKLMTSDPDPDSLEGLLLMALAKEVEVYEKGRFKFDTPNAEEMAQFRKEREEEE